MRICIDATSLLLRSAGVKNYVYHWMRSLQQEAPQLEVGAFPLLGQVGALDHERSVLSLAQTIPRIALLHFFNVRFNPAIDLAMASVDVFHASNLMRNLPRRTKLTATIYDMTVRLLPHLHTEGNVRAENAFYQAVLKRADGLIAISESAKHDAIEQLNLEPDRVKVIYPGIDERFFSARPSADISLKYGLPKPYLLFVGTIEPRKNIDAILDAYQALPRDTREAFDLAIAGPLGWAQGATVNRIKQGFPGLRVLGYISEEDLPALTAGAAAFVYPSLYEGFGFPVAQAMAAGVPVITSNLSSLPEVAEGAGFLVDPKSVSEIRNAMEDLLTSATSRQELAAAGRRKAMLFRWQNSAVQSAKFFESLA
jgi:glycosyltransferase involved in cell wall biosynthesis